MDVHTIITIAERGYPGGNLYRRGDINAWLIRRVIQRSYDPEAHNEEQMEAASKALGAITEILMDCDNAIDRVLTELREPV